MLFRIGHPYLELFSSFLEKQEAPSFESYGAEGGESGSSVTTLDEDKGGFGGKKFTKKEAQTPRTTARSQLPLTFSEMKATIQKLTKGNEEDYAIFTTFASFNRHILRTNFFKKVKSSLTFRLTGEALTVPYGTGGKSAQDKPYGIYFFICGEGRGFHIRFGNIARGGIRLVKSPSQQAYTVNVRFTSTICRLLSLLCLISLVIYYYFLYSDFDD